MNNFPPRPAAMMGAGFPPAMQQQPQQPQQHTQQVPTQIREFIFARIRAQGSVPMGWQTQVSEGQRAGSVLHIYTSFRLARPPPGPEEARSMLNQSVLFESKVFSVSKSRDQYQTAIQGKLQQLSDMRGRQASNMPLGAVSNANIQPQGNQNAMQPPQQQQQQQQQQAQPTPQQPGMMGQPAFNPSFNPQMSQQMGIGIGGPPNPMSQASRQNPMAQQQQQQQHHQGQQHPQHSQQQQQHQSQNNINGSNNGSNNMQQMLSRAGQAFPNQNLSMTSNPVSQLQNQNRLQQQQQSQQQLQQQQQPNQQSQTHQGQQQQQQQQQVRPLALPQNDADKREVQHISQMLVQQLKSQGRFEEMQRECMQRASPSQQAQMRNNNITPFDMWVRKKALELCQRRKQQNMPPQGQTNNGNMGRNQQSGQQGAGGMPGLSSGPGNNGSLSFGSFLSQQTEANRAQEAGEPVVPASNNNQSFGQQGGKQNIFSNVTNGQQPSTNNNVMNGMSGNMGPNNASMGMPNTMASMQQQQPFAQNQANRGLAGNNQSQNRLQTPMNNNNNRANGNVLMGHGLQGGPQQSPAMHVLNRAMGPPGDQNRNEKPPERNTESMQQSGQQSQQNVQSARPNFAQPQVDPQIPPAMMEQLSQRLAGLPPEQRSKAMAQFQATFRQRQMQQQNNQANSNLHSGMTGSNDQAKNLMTQNINGSQGPSGNNASHSALTGGQLQQGMAMKASDPNALSLPRGVLSQNLPELQLPAGIGTWGQLHMFLKQNPGFLTPMNMQKLSSIHSAHFARVMESRQQAGLGPLSQQQQQQQSQQQSQQQQQQPQQQQQQQQVLAQPRPQMPQQPLQIPQAQTSQPQASQLLQHPANLQMSTEAGVPVPPNRMDEAQKLVRDNVLQFAGQNLVKISATEQELAQAKQQILMAGQANAQNTSDFEVRKKICLSKLRRVQSIDPYWAQKLFVHTQKSLGLNNDASKQPNNGPGFGQLPNRPLMGPHAPAFPGGMPNQQLQPGMLGPMMNARPQPGQMSPTGPNTGPMGPNNNAMQPQAPQMQQGFGRGTTPFKQSGAEPPNGITPLQATQFEALKNRAMQGASRQQAAVSSMMASARAGPLVPPEQREARWREIESDAQRTVSMRTASQGPPPSIDAEYWTSRVGQFINNGMQMYPGAIRTFFMSGGNERVARDLRTALEFLQSQQMPNGEFRFTLSGDELRDIFTKIVTFSQAYGNRSQGPFANQQRQQPAPAAPANAPASGSTTTSASTTTAAAPTAAPQAKKPAAAKNNSKAPQAPTTSQPPFAIGQPTPDGKPFYAQGNEITQDQLKLPSKRRKLNNQSTPKDTGKTTPMQPPEVQATAPQPTAKTAPVPTPQPEVIIKDWPHKCSIPGCDLNKVGFQKDEERRKHEKEVHGYSGTPLDFLKSSLQKGLGSGETLSSRPADAIKAANGAQSDGSRKRRSPADDSSPESKSLSSPNSWDSCKISVEEISNVFEDMEGISTLPAEGLSNVKFINPPTPPATPPKEEQTGAKQTTKLPPLINWDPFEPEVDKNEIKPLTPREAALEAKPLRLLIGSEKMDFSWEFLDADEGSPFKDFVPIDLEQVLAEDAKNNP